MPPPGVRLIRFGDLFDSDELRRGIISLELPRPADEPPENMQTEPWGLKEESDDPHHFRLRDKLREYRRHHSGDDQ